MVQLSAPVVVQEPPTNPFKSRAVTEYPVIADPPFDVGAVHETITIPLPPVATTPVDAPGVVEGTTGPDGADVGDVPPE
jgi:hypothetical protein